MSFDQLKNYVINQRNAGISDEVIIEALRAKHWHEDLIAKAMSESESAPAPNTSELDLSTRLLSPGELITVAWDSLIANFSNYAMTTFISLLLPIITVIIFILPIIYDIRVLHFTGADFMSRSIWPILALHLLIGFLTILTVSFWGSLAIYITAIHEGKLSPRHAYKRAWERLPGFAWVGILSSLITIAGLIIFLIPGLLFSVYLSFSGVAYVAHGARGKSALLSSIALVHGRWWKTFWRILFPTILIILILSIVGSLLPGIGGFIAQLFLTPLMVIYIYLLYTNYTSFDKQHPKNSDTKIDEVVSELNKAEK